MTDEEKEKQRRWDQFAMAAVTGLASRGTFDLQWIARESKALADLMMKP